MIWQTATLAGAWLIFLLCVFQILLACGVPWGRAAWRGKHRVLPYGLRWASLGAVFLLFAASWVLLARGGRLAPSSGHPVIRVLSWVFAGWFLLNTLLNLRSPSNAEKLIMTPVSGILSACFFIVSLS